MALLAILQRLIGPGYLEASLAQLARLGKARGKVQWWRKSSWGMRIIRRHDILFIEMKMKSAYFYRMQALLLLKFYHLQALHDINSEYNDNIEKAGWRAKIDIMRPG